jgi:hypothetical protein
MGRVGYAIFAFFVVFGLLALILPNGEEFAEKVGEAAAYLVVGGYVIWRLLRRLRGR